MIDARLVAVGGPKCPSGPMNERFMAKCAATITIPILTGVAVSPAMVHGGPFPATGDARFTAVGLPSAAKRFSKALCLDRVR